MTAHAHYDKIMSLMPERNLSDKKQDNSKNTLKTKAHLVTGSQNVLYPSLYRAVREIRVPVYVSENYFVRPVLLEKLSEQSGLKSGIHGRVVNHDEKSIALLSLRRNLSEAQAEPFSLAKIELFVMLRVVGAARTAPPARTAYDNVAEPDAVVLKKIKSVVGSGTSQLAYAVPPIVVVTPDEHLFAWKTFQRAYVAQSLFQRRSPACVAAEQHYVLHGNLGHPVRLYLFEMSFPTRAEYVHRLVHRGRKVQIANRKNFHGDIIAHTAVELKQFVKGGKFMLFLP